MKLVSIILAILFATLSVNAQDKIITQDGDVIIGYATEVGSSSVFYRLSSDESTSLKKIPKENVLMIKYANGEKITLGGNSEPASSTQTKTNASAISEASIQRNQELLRKYNDSGVVYTNEKKKKKAETAKRVCCQLLVSDDSQLCDDNIEIEYSMGMVVYEYIDKRLTAKNLDKKVASFENINCPQVDPAIKIKVKNKSNNTVYLDLGQSYFMRQGEAEVYYVPSATSTTSGSSSGAGVNLGSIAGAAGIGGAIGQIAGGINVGSSSGVTETTTVYSQRVVSIPPHSSTELTPKALIPCEKSGSIGVLVGGGNITTLRCPTSNLAYEIRVCMFQQAKDKMVDGAVWYKGTLKDYVKAIPNWGAYITYSTDADFTSTSSLTTNFYLGKLVGGRIRDINIVNPQGLLFMARTNL